MILRAGGCPVRHPTRRRSISLSVHVGRGAKPDHVPGARSAIGSKPILRTSAGLTASGPILAAPQGTILVLALFFVLLNLAVDLLQTALDPRIRLA